MITGLGGSTIWSSDVNNLLPFYRDVIGLPMAMEGDGFYLLGEANMPKLALGTHSGVKGKASDPFRHMVGLMTNDIHGDAKRLKAAGVEFIEEPNDLGDLTLATIKDPEGNLVQLLQFTG